MTLLTFLAEKSKQSGMIILFITLSCFILIPPSIIASIRDMNVGVDVMVYEKNCFALAQHYESFFEYCEKLDGIEFFFKIINWVAASISNSICVALFLIEFIFLLFAYLASYRMRDYAPMWLSMLIFLLCYYNLSYNLMRQMIAMSFLTLSFTYLLRDDNLKRFFVMAIVAFLFHKTATMAAMFFFAIFYMYRQNTKIRRRLVIIYSCLCVAIVVIFKMILSWLSQLGGRFADYVAYGGEGDKASFKPTILTLLVLGDILLLVVSYIAKRYKISSDRTIFILQMLVITDLMSEFLGKYTGFATRMSCYFCMPYMFLLPNIFMSEKLAQGTRWLMSVLLVLSFFIIWVRMVGMTGRTIPYKSEILGL